MAIASSLDTCIGAHSGRQQHRSARATGACEVAYWDCWAGRPLGRKCLHLARKPPSPGPRPQPQGRDALG
jgi:hypothetical protein